MTKKAKIKLLGSEKKKTEVESAVLATIQNLSQENLDIVDESETLQNNVCSVGRITKLESNIIIFYLKELCF